MTDRDEGMENQAFDWIAIDRRFRHDFLLLALGGLCVALVGFSSTYFVPLIGRGESFPGALHIHGAFCFAWLLVFLTQSVLVKQQKVVIHRMVGTAGALVALGVLITMQLAGVHMVDAGLENGLGDRAYGSVTGPFFDSLLFAAFVFAALIFRKRRDFHGRLMLLATILILWVAWSRWRHYLPEFPGRDIFFAYWLAMAPIPVLWWHERRKSGVIHPVMLWGGLLVIMQQGAQVMAADTFWRRAGRIIYDVWSSIA